MLFLAINNWYYIIPIITLALLLITLITVMIYVNQFVKASSEDKREVYTMLNQSASPNSIVFLGDSLTEFYKIDEFFHNIDHYNRGIAGDTTDGVINRLYDNVISIKPKKIFLQIGTNDLGNGKKPDYVVENIHRILDMIQVQLPKTEIFLISLYPVNPKASPYSRIITGRRKNKDIDTINARLVELAKELSVNYIDVAQVLKDDKGNLNDDYTIEGLHICLHGYMLISEVLRPYVF